MSSAKIGALRVDLGMNTAAFEKGADLATRKLSKVSKKIEQMGKSMGDMGRKLSIGVTAPLILLAKKSVDGFIEQEKAMADVNAALKSMGNASGKTSRELLKTSDALELKSMYDGDQILKEVTANLLTFGNVANEQFDRAQQAALDMATRLGTGPKEAIIQIGKALNDPIKGVSALSRVGIQFTEDQKKVLESLVETGQIAKAQGIILGELEKQFGGAAEAAANADPYRKLNVLLGQSMDVIGHALLPAITAIATKLAIVAGAFSELDPFWQKFIVFAGVAAAAVGPLLMVFGPLVSALAGFIATVKVIAATQGLFVALTSGVAGLGVALLPLAGLALAAYLAWENWDTIKPVLMEIVDELTALGEGLGLVEGKAGRTSEELAKNQGLRDLGQQLRSASDEIQAFATAFENASRDSALASRAWIDGLGPRWDAFSANVRSATLGVVSAIGSMISDGIEYVAKLYYGVKEWLGDKLSEVLTGVGKKLGVVGQLFFKLYDSVIGHSYVPDMVDGIEREFARLQKVMVTPAKKAADQVKAEMREMAAETSALLDRLFPKIAQFRQFQKERDLIEKSGLSDDLKGEARFRLGTETFGNAGRFQLSSYITEDKALKVKFDDVAEAHENLAEKTKIQTVKIAESFASMAQNAIQSLQGLISSIKGGGFLDILGSVFGILDKFGIFGGSGKGSGLISAFAGLFAGGGRFPANKFGIVGENGPELFMPGKSGMIVPNHQLGKMGGGGGGGVTLNVDARGATDPAAVRKQIEMALAEAAPVIMAASEARTVRTLMRPRLAGLGR